MEVLAAVEPLLSEEAMALAQRCQEEDGDVASFLLSASLLSPDRLLRALAHHHGVPFVPLKRYRLDPGAVARMSHESARHFGLLPLFMVDDELYCATADPDDLDAQEFVKRLTGMPIRPVLALRGDLEEALGRAYLGKDQAAEAIKELSGSQPAQRAESESGPQVKSEEGPVVRLVNHILSQGIHLRASDIHLEATRDRVLLRYRVDGTLHEFPPPPLERYAAIVSRIKIMSSLDISERRLPQDGRLAMKVNDVEYELRVSVIPNVHGEGIVLRVLDPQGSMRDLASLGLSPAMLASFERMIRKPYGIFLVTGPTGSGKSTTLYSVLKRIYTPSRKFVTVEDPVEADMEGVTQIQVHPDIGFGWGEALRSILRHDPDVVMVGEIRDLESAEIAFRASLTGHLLFSTLHTNDAPLAVLRLADMGVQPFLITSSLLGVLAQRLVRRLCVDCKTPVEVDDALLESLGVSALPPGATLYRPRGCDGCRNLGYKGRVGIYEMLEVTAEMRHLPASRLNSETIRELARKTGFTTLRESALEKLYEGMTSVEEVVSLTVDE